MENIVDTNIELLKLDQLDKSAYFLDLMNTNSFEIGILRLEPGQKDIQTTHTEDEIYFVIDGEGHIRIHENDYEIKKGFCIFIPSNAEHHFYGNKNRLTVLYIFNKR